MSSLPPTSLGPVTMVLLHSPLDDAATWSRTAEETRGHSPETRVIRVSVTGADREAPGHRYIARAALDIAAAEPGRTVFLVAAGAAGPLLPRLGAAQRSAHRQVVGYALVDAFLPQPGVTTWAGLAREQVGADLADLAGAEPDLVRRWRDSDVPTPVDWPDAPCAYVCTDERFRHCLRLAKLRGWDTQDLTTAPEPTIAPAGAAELATTLLRLSQN